MLKRLCQMEAGPERSGGVGLSPVKIHFPSPTFSRVCHSTSSMRLLLLFLVLLGLASSQNVAAAHVKRAKASTPPAQNKVQATTTPPTTTNAYSVWTSIVNNDYGQVSTLCKNLLGPNTPSTTTLTKTSTRYQDYTLTVTATTKTVSDTVKVTVGTTYTATNNKVTYVTNGVTVTKIVPYFPLRDMLI